MIDTIKVNNKTIPWLYVERGFEIPSFNYVLKTENVDGRSGSIYKGRRLESYSFDIPLVVRNDYLSHNGIKTHDDVLNELVKFFNYEEQVKLQFKSKDWYWNAYFEGPIKLHKEFTIPVKFTIKVVLTDPYKYSVTGNKNTAISDQVSVVNSGTADTPLIVEARAIKPSSYFMITKNDEDYFMVGDDEVTKEVKDYMPPVYHSEFRDFKGWVGAGTKRGLPKAMTDFQITYKCIVEQKGKGAGRTAQHIYDSDGKLLASIGYENKYHDRKIGHIVVTLYNQKGDPKKIYDYQNKPIMYNLDRIVVYMRLRRVGNKFSIKTWKFDHIKDPDRRKPIDMDEKEWIDGGKFYQRPASIIAIYSAKYNGYKWMEMNGLGSFNTEILPKPKGARDVIIQKGDLVKIDMQAKSVVINEEPMLSEKSFGSNYFNVDSGYSELIIQPENVFDTTVKWQDRYL